MSISSISSPLSPWKRVALHFDQVDDAAMVVLESDRKLHQHWIVTELLAKLIANFERVGTGSIALVDERQTRDVVAAHLAVDSERLTLHSGNRAQDQDRTIEDSKRTLNFNGEVDVSWRVNDVDLVVVPRAIRRRTGDRDAALFFELHRIHLRANAVFAFDVVNRVDPICVEENPLGESGFATVDVGGNTDVAKL